MCLCCVLTNAKTDEPNAANHGEVIATNETNAATIAEKLLHPIQCNAMQCNARQYNTMQCNTIQYSQYPHPHPMPPAWGGVGGDIGNIVLCCIVLSAVPCPLSPPKFF